MPLQLPLLNLKYYEYQEYHTSADDLSFVSAENLEETLSMYMQWFELVESFCHPKRRGLKGEFCLGKRGLYPQIGGAVRQPSLTATDRDLDRTLRPKLEITSEHLEAFNWLMHLGDGSRSNFEISSRSGIHISVVNEAISIFQEDGLLER